MPRSGSRTRDVLQQLGRILLWAGASIAALPLLAQAQRRPARPVTTAAPPLRFQWVGPEPAGRIAAVAGVPGDTSTYYFGAASGGVWKTTDGARTFTPVFDEQPVQAIGALAVAPSNPRVVWAGTGEAWAIRDADVMGDGVYQSTDAGRTWKNMGLRETGRIGRIVIHPRDPDIVLVCALGRATGPQEERGVYKTTDGGRTWKRVLFVDPDTGCSGLAIDPTHPEVLFAGTWQVVMHTWAMFGGGPGSGLFVSRDTGSTWTRIADPGLPKPPLGKIDVAVAPSNAKRVYALIQTADQGSLWRSDDGGGKWKRVSGDRRLIGRAGYYIRVAVNPENDLEVLVANSSFHRSYDGGETFPITGGGCGDCHDIWMDPLNPSHWAATGDGGAGITRDHGHSFRQVALPIGQMYHVAIDDRVPYWIYSNRQDDGTMRGPSDRPVPVPQVPSLARAGGGGPGFLPPGVGRDTTLSAAAGGPARPGDGSGFGRRGPAGSAWQGPLGGCESGFTLPTPGNPDVIWASCYGNTVTRYDARVERARSVSPGIHTLDSPPDELQYRCHWTPPLAIDPFDPNTVYYGCQVIFKTTTAGQRWAVISPDLSTRDSSRIVSSGGLAGDNLGQFYGEVVFAIAPSPIRRGLIWAGTNDGKLWYTPNGGGRWVDVSANLPGLPPWGTVRQITPSRFDPAAAYVAVDRHLMDDRVPYLYKTADFGKTWTRIDGGLPRDHPLAYLMSVAENPNRRGMLFAGTGNGFYYSFDDGATWTRFRAGLPAAPVSWITVAKDQHDVVVSTYGRGLFVLRDITPLEQSDRLAAGAPVRILEPRAGFRMARDGSADFTFLLAKAPEDSVRVEILDSTGAVIRTVKVSSRAGLNRYVWDLRHDGPKQVELRTTPPNNPGIWDEPRFKDKEFRPVIHWGIDGPQRLGPLAAPGRYSVRITADSVSAMQAFRVLEDPGLAASEADLLASTVIQLRIRNDIDTAVAMINEIERLRHQVEDRLAGPDSAGAGGEALRALDAKMLAVELQLLSESDLQSDDKWYVEKYRVYMNLVWLAGEVGTGAGDVAGGAEFRPTEASLRVLAGIEKDLDRAKAAYAALRNADLPAFNQSEAGKRAPIT